VSEAAISPATEFLTPLLHGQQELEPTLNALDLTGISTETSQQFQQELSMILHKQKPSNAQFYSSLFNTDSILSYLPAKALLILDEPMSIQAAVEVLDTQANELRTEQIEQGELPHNFPHPYLTWQELELRMKERQCMMLTAFGITEDELSYRLNFAPAPSYAGQLPVFIKKIKQMLTQRNRLILISHQASRLSELLDEEDIIAPPLS